MTTQHTASSAIAPALTIDAARALALNAVETGSARETLALGHALGRVLAVDLHAPFDVPAYDHAAMDGYAFAAAALGGATDVSLRLAGAVLAGHAFGGTVQAGECVRIMTGAPLPPGCDTVVAQEQTSREGDTVRFAGHAVGAGANVRRTGEDLARGALVLGTGRVLRAADLGLAASLGHAELTVRRRVRVALLSTGDELSPPGSPLPPGGRYDSNRALLAGMLAPLPVEILDLGLVDDDPAALEAALRAAAAQADVILTSGGVSVGDADFTRELLARLGQVSFVNLAMRPGRPFACGRIRAHAADNHSSLFFGLPGNPVAAAAAFLAIVRDALLAQAGADARPAPRYPARTTQRLAKRAGRTEFLRGAARRDAQGIWHVTPASAQSSASLSGLSAADCFIVLAPDTTEIDAGSVVEILPFDGIL